MWFKSNFTTPAVAAISFCLIGGTVPGTAYADLGDQLAKLLADNGASLDRFGHSVAISGPTAIVGAWGNDENGERSGSTYLFDTTTGLQIAKLLPDDSAEQDEFGVSVAISGATGKQIAIVGARADDDNGDDSGSAYHFDISDPANPTQIAKLLANDGAEGDGFGISVAISGATAIVGAWFDRDNGFQSGSAYLFDISDPANPTKIAKLLPNDGAERDGFGISVAISGATAIVGAWFDDDKDHDSGSAYLFDTTTGRQIAKLLPNDGAADDRFGSSVAISGDTAIIGAYWDDDNGINSGSAYLFDISDPTNPGQIAKLLADEGAAGDRFGSSVAIGGATAIVGAYGDDDNGEFSGSVYLFDVSDPNNPAQIVRLLADDSAAGVKFGCSVATSVPPGKEIAIVGAYGYDDNGDLSGSAYLFDAAGPRKVPVGPR